jgi:hypothetical protein
MRWTTPFCWPGDGSDGFASRQAHQQPSVCLFLPLLSPSALPLCLCLSLEKWKIGGAPDFLRAVRIVAEAIQKKGSQWARICKFAPEYRFSSRAFLWRRSSGTNLRPIDAKNNGNVDRFDLTLLSIFFRRPGLPRRTSHLERQRKGVGTLDWNED